MKEAFLPTIAELPQHLHHTTLDGSIGTNRAELHLCQISAKNDLEAVHCWLNEYKNRETTYRSYQKEAERLLLWCVNQKQKPLSSLTREDLEVYFEFLSDPKPRHLWCAERGKRENRRGQPGWRPFIGPLNTSAKKTAISIIQSLFNYLIAARYLAYNPFSLMRNISKRNNIMEENKIQVIQRILEPAEWEAMLETLNTMPEVTIHEGQEKERLRFLLAILYLLGLRVSELANHTWSAFRKVQGKWWFFVVGKGGKLGKIPVNQSLLDAIKHYRTYFKMTSYPSPEEQVPIIQSWRSSKGLSPRQMHGLLKELALKTAQQFSDKSEKAAKLKKFSPHWLRHLSASMQDKVGISFKHIKANHRHENDETTRIYVHAKDDERHEDMEKLKFLNLSGSEKNMNET